MLRKMYISLLGVFLLVCSGVLSVCSGSEEQRIPEIDLGGGFKLVPYTNNHRAALESIVNDPAVCTTIRHGDEWDQDLLDKRHRFYVDKNAAFNRGEPYSPQNFSVCWVLEDKEGKIWGRGGLQDSDECEPIMTEVFFAVSGGYQWRPGANNLGLGQRSFGKIIEWFHTHVGKDIPLRWLSMPNNGCSRHLALKLGFKPAMKGDKQVEIDGWGNPYCVYEMQ